MQAKASVIINRPIGEVYDYVVDVANMPRWVSGVRAARQVDAVMANGARYVLEYMGGWRANELEVVVSEFDRPTTFATQISRGPFAFEGTMRFSEVEGGTEVTNAIEAGPDSIASRIAGLLFGWFLRGSTSRRLQRELETLQQSIEGDSSLKT